MAVRSGKRMPPRQDASFRAEDERGDGADQATRVPSETAAAIESVPIRPVALRERLRLERVELLLRDRPLVE
jgi:hypothetical protein